MKIRRPETPPFQDIFVFVMYYVYGASGLIESTDSMIFSWLVLANNAQGYILYDHVNSLES